jgi:hypothetical protein
MKSLVHIHSEEKLSLPPEEKEELLISHLSQIPSLMVALSGGADSAYLGWAAHHALGNRSLSVTALSPSFSSHDKQIVEEFVNRVAVRHEFIETHEMENPAYRANQLDRCYFCKDELFSVLGRLARSRMALMPMTRSISVPAIEPLPSIKFSRRYSTPASQNRKFACSPDVPAFPLGTAQPPHASLHACPTAPK